MTTNKENPMAEQNLTGGWVELPTPTGTAYVHTLSVGAVTPYTRYHVVPQTVETDPLCSVVHVDGKEILVDLPVFDVLRLVGVVR